MGKKKGGQLGHPKHYLPKFNDEEVNVTEVHEMDQCPNCSGELEFSSEGRSKDEFDFEVVLIKKRHFFPEYQCGTCHKKFLHPFQNS